MKADIGQYLAESINKKTNTVATVQLTVTIWKEIFDNTERIVDSWTLKVDLANIQLTLNSHLRGTSVTPVKALFSIPVQQPLWVPCLAVYSEDESSPKSHLFLLPLALFSGWKPWKWVQFAVCSVLCAECIVQSAQYTVPSAEGNVQSVVIRV